MMTIGPALPEGNGFEGVDAVKDYIHSARKLGIGQSGKINAAFACGIASRCNPWENPSSYRNCQRAALGTAANLVAVAAQSSSESERVAAFDALGMMLNGANEEFAGSVLKDVNVEKVLVKALGQALDINHAVSQSERQAALYCMRALTVLESSESFLLPLLDHIRALLVAKESVRAVKADALCVLSSLASSPDCKALVAEAMDDDALSVVMDELAPVSGEHCLAFGLLLADVLDFGLRFSHAVRTISNDHGFMEHFRDALDASVHQQAWPLGTNCSPALPRMAYCALQLTEIGMREQMTDAVPLLLDMIDVCADAEELALAALRQLAEVPAVLSILASRQAFLKTLGSLEAAELLAHIEHMEC